MVDPFAPTVPISGVMVTLVASVEDQERVEDSPFFIDVGLAEKESVGFGGGGSGGGGSSGGGFGGGGGG